MNGYLVFLSTNTKSEPVPSFPLSWNLPQDDRIPLVFVPFWVFGRWMSVVNAHWYSSFSSRLFLDCFWKQMTLDLSSMRTSDEFVNCFSACVFNSFFNVFQSTWYSLRRLVIFNILNHKLFLNSHPSPPLNNYAWMFLFLRMLCGLLFWQYIYPDAVVFKSRHWRNYASI